MNLKLNKSTYEINPQTRTRPPVVHLFWRFSILFGLLFGFTSGIYLWLFLNRQIEETADYFFLIGLHANVQLLIFFGLFILGFVFTAGFHLNGGKPASFGKIIWILPAAIIGFILLLVPSAIYVGQGIISLCFAYSGFLMFQAAKEGNFQRVPLNVLTLLGLLTFTIAPWLNLSDTGSSFYVVLGGPVLFVFMAGLQLIPNVMKGDPLGEENGSIFALLIVSGYFLLVVHTFLKPVPLFFICGLYGTAALFYLKTVNIVKAVRFCGPTSLSIAFIFGFTWFLLSLVLLVIYGEDYLDNVIHLLVLGQIMTHVIAVGSRVLGFFSGDYVLAEEKLIGMLLVWQIVPFTRGLDIVFNFPYWVSWITAIVTGGIMLVWSLLMFNRIRKV